MPQHRRTNQPTNLLNPPWVVDRFRRGAYRRGCALLISHPRWGVSPSSTFSSLAGVSSRCGSDGLNGPRVPGVGWVCGGSPGAPAASPPTRRAWRPLLRGRLRLPAPGWPGTGGSLRFGPGRFEPPVRSHRWVSWRSAGCAYGWSAHASSLRSSLCPASGCRLSARLGRAATEVRQGVGCLGQLPEPAWPGTAPAGRSLPSCRRAVTPSCRTAVTPSLTPPRPGPTSTPSPRATHGPPAPG